MVEIIIKKFSKPEYFIILIALFIITSIISVNDPDILRFNPDLSIGFKSIIALTIFSIGILIGIRKWETMENFKIPIIVVISILLYLTFYELVSSIAIGPMLLALSIPIIILAIQKIKETKYTAHVFFIGIGIMLTGLILYGIPAFSLETRYVIPFMLIEVAGFYLAFIGATLDIKKRRLYQVILIIITLLTTYRKLFLMTLIPFTIIESIKKPKLVIPAIFSLLTIWIIGSTALINTGIDNWNLDAIKSIENRFAIWGSMFNDVVESSWPVGDSYTFNDRALSIKTHMGLDISHRDLNDDVPSLAEPFAFLGVIGMFLSGLIIGYALKSSYETDSRLYTIVYAHMIMLLITPIFFIPIVSSALYFSTNIKHRLR